MPARSSGNAALSYNAQACTGLLSVTVTHNTDMLDAADINDQRKSYVAGQATSTLSGECFYDQGDAAMAAMEGDSVNPTSRAVVVTMDTGMTITGNAFVSSFSSTAGTNDVLRASFELQFTGTVTIA